MPELALEITELIDKGISFISLNDSVDLSTTTGRLQFHIICAFAEFERDLIRERTLDGLERARRQGKKLGRPFGSRDKKKEESKVFTAMGQEKFINLYLLFRLTKRGQMRKEGGVWVFLYLWYISKFKKKDLYRLEFISQSKKTKDLNIRSNY